MTPPLFLEIWDWDLIGSDEIMCSCRVNLYDFKHEQKTNKLKTETKTRIIDLTTKGEPNLSDDEQTELTALRIKWDEE